MLSRFVFLLFIFLLGHLPAPAQPPSGWKPVTAAELKMTAADIGDPEASAAVLFREGYLNDDSGGGTELLLYIRIKIFNDRGRRFAEVQLPYKVEVGKISDVSARTIRPDGSIVEVAGRDIFDKLTLKTSTGTHRAKVFSMPAAQPGAIIEYRYRQTYPKGFRYFALDLQADLFIKDLLYQIRPPLMSKSDVRWVTFNVDDPGRFKPVWDGTYDIRAQNIKPYQIEPMMPPEATVKMWGWLYYSAEFETTPDKYWRDYAERMHKEALTETRPTKTIHQVVESITAAKDTPAEKLGRIYKYVQSEIQNLGPKEEREPPAENGDFKQNRSADETIHRRYGTPREINRLFIAMLRAAGFDARVAELVTRDENYFYKSFADAFQLNGEATAVVMPGGSLQFYDPGTPFCPPGSLAWEKEAVTALVYGSPGGSPFAETPVTDAERNTEENRMTIRPLSDGRVEVEVEARVTGLRARDFRSELKGLTREQQRHRMLTSAKDRLPAAIVDEASVKVSDALNVVKANDAFAAYSFTLPQAATLTEKRLLLRPALLTRRDETFLPATNRVNSLYFHYPWSESESGVIAAPDGYDIEQLPDPVELDIGAATYRSSFRRDGARVLYERKLVVNAIVFTAAQYANVKAFFDRVHQADRALISVKQN